MIVLMILAVIKNFQTNAINDDVGWAISNGWHLLTQGWHYHLTTSWVVARPYRSTEPEWLTDGLFYLIYANTGWAGMVLIVQLLLGGGLFWAFWRAKKSGSNLTVMFAFLVFMEGLAGFLVDRPQIFTYLFLVLYLWWRSEWGKTGSMIRLGTMSRFLTSEWIWLIVMPLWASLHGGFALFYPLFLIDTFARQSYRSLLIVPMTMAEIALFMPNHLYNLFYPFLWQSVPYDRYITEVAPMGFAGSNVIVMIVLALAGVLIWRRIKSVDRFILVLLGLFALHSVRNLPFYTIWVLWFLPVFRLEDWIHVPGIRDFMAVDQESFVLSKRFARWAMPTAMATLVLLYPWIQPNVHAFQNSTAVDNKALHFLVKHANVLHYIGYEPMQYSDELSLWGDQNYLESQQDVWAGVISPKKEPNLTMNAMKVSTGQIPLTQAWGYAKMRYILVRNGSVMDNEVKLLSTEWAPTYHDKFATIYVRKSYIHLLKTKGVKSAN